MEIQTLAELPAGSSAIIRELRTDPAETRHLAESGVFAGAEIACKMRGAGGSPIAFSVHGVTLALRAETCEKIITETKSRPPVYLLAGNPNVGKSTVFNALTGLRQHTGNWCGKTVSGAKGIMRHGKKRIRLIDTPGTYSVRSDTAEEAVTGTLISRTPHDCVICIIDATCPVRGLVLLLEIMEQESSVVLCCNLMDEAHRAGIRIDLRGLSEALRIPVLGITAQRKQSLKAIPAAAEQAVRNPRPLREAQSRAALYQEAIALKQNMFTMPPAVHPKTQAADRLLTGRLLRLPLMLLLLFGVFWLTLTGANIPSAWLDAVLSGGCDHLAELADAAAFPAWLSGALIDGMIRGTCRVIAVMLPPMAIFFPLFTLLEDIGLLPRIAFNCDRCCAKCGACGKQALTAAMGFGCNAVGVTGCRIIEGPRERLIAILTNSFIPCNGRFPSLLTVTTVFFAGTGAFRSLHAACIMTALILLSLTASLSCSALLSKSVLRKDNASFVLELPPYRRPQICTILVRSILDRTVFVLGRAAAVAAPMNLLIWILANLRIGEQTLLLHIAAFLDPFGAVLGLDGVLLLAFMLGLPANEIVLPVALTAYLGIGTLAEQGSLTALHAILTANGWTHVTAICFLIFTLFHAPCATTLLTVYKETGSRRITFAAWLLPTVTGIVLCALTAFLMRI